MSLTLGSRWPCTPGPGRSPLHGWPHSDPAGRAAGAAAGVGLFLHHLVVHLSSCDLRVGVVLQTPVHRNEGGAGSKECDGFHRGRVRKGKYVKEQREKSSGDKTIARLK